VDGGGDGEAATDGGSDGERPTATPPVPRPRTERAHGDAQDAEDVVELLGVVSVDRSSSPDSSSAACRRRRRGGAR
jgi:hypothetical protein